MFKQQTKLKLQSRHVSAKLQEGTTSGARQVAVTSLNAFSTIWTTGTGYTGCKESIYLIKII